MNENAITAVNQLWVNSQRAIAVRSPVPTVLISNRASMLCAKHNMAAALMSATGGKLPLWAKLAVAAGNPTGHRNPMLYIITAWQFNHVDRGISLDERLTDPRLDPVFYFVDRPPESFPHPSIIEPELNPRIAEAGRLYLAEWSFLMTELERPFAHYPFFVTSSRFFEKNQLVPSLGDLWSDAIAALGDLGWGYLPSYDRPAGFVDLAEYLEHGRLGMCEAGLAFVDGYYGVRIPQQYRLMSDFFCNYLGFASRAHFERYMAFYVPFIRRFLDQDWRPIRDPELYVRRRNVFREEKPFTLLLEMVSHLFFYSNRIPFVGVKDDQLYRVLEWEGRMEPVSAATLTECQQQG